MALPPVRRALLGLGLLVLASTLGCGPGPSTPPAETPEATRPRPTQVLPTSTPTSTPLPASLPLLPLPDDPPPPMDFLDGIEAGVTAGKWTSEQGLLTALRYVAEVGVSQEDEAAFSGVVRREASGILASARDLARSGPLRAEIDRLVRILAPPIDLLLPYATQQPIGTGALVRTSGVAQPAQPAVDCKSLWLAGFPAASAATCFLYTERTLGTSPTTRVYYPADWWPNDPRLAYATAAEEAIGASLQVFSQFGETRRVDLVFALIGQAADFAAVVSPGGEETCLVVVYPEGVNLGEQRGVEVFQQVVAHELFHCFQGWNMPEPFDADYKVQRWWLEGSADYFSNVVYPEVNFEWESVPIFDQHSLNRPIHKMSYENALFFQYLGTAIGDAAIIDLLRTLPAAGGHDAQASAVGSYPAMQELFHEFGRQYLDGLITDTSGEVIPHEVYFDPKDHLTIAGPSSAALGSDALLLRRLLISFATGRQFAVSTKLDSGEGLFSGRPDPGVGGWDSLPDELESSCELQQFVMLVTAAGASAAPIGVSLQAGVQDVVPCDECVVGIWELSAEDLAAFLTSLASADTSDVHTVSNEGIWRFEYKEDGTYHWTVDVTQNAILQSSTISGSPLNYPIEVTIQSAGDGEYWTLPDGWLGTKNQAYDSRILLFFNGIGGEIGAFSGAGISTGEALSSYTCTPERLTFTNSRYDRVLDGP